MFDIWGFLLQTLTVSGVAALLLIIKALLKDKLPPKWHFSVWSVLGIMIIFPAGIFSRYTLFNWQTVIDFFKLLVKDYSFTRVLFPFPIIKDVPHTLAEWIFFIYFAGVIINLFAYLLSYIRIRIVLRRGNSPDIETISTINTIGHKYKIKPCKVVVVSNLPSAFICGIIRPVLVIPEKRLDEKVILHELFHLKNKDTFWSIVICILRCLHWCNPLIAYCANLAINDMESRCDQFVLEQLEGEERRDYGRILLSMSNERFAKTPGSTCINNGGKNIRKRIEAIARFKKYPVGMSLVSVCVIIALSCSLVVGVQATDIPNSHKTNYWSFAKSKSTYCTTYAGAFDTYAKAVMTESINYRIMCSPEDTQAELIESTDIKWESGLSGSPESSNYYIYNLEMPQKDVYEGLLVMKLVNEPDGYEWVEGKHYLAHQKIRVFKENSRWVVTELNDFNYSLTDIQWLEYGCSEIPCTLYTSTIDDYKVETLFQTIYKIDNQTPINNDVFSSLGSSRWSFNNVPVLNAEFDMAYDNHESKLTHLGTQEERDSINKIGIAVKSVHKGDEKPDSITYVGGDTDTWSSSTDGTSSAVRTLEPGWGPSITLSGGGGGGTFSQLLNIDTPEYYVCDLYVNNEFYTRTELHLQKEE
ncbi:MAG: M56 family metallopeptidase [Clostridia bacterium]|nr:M56 family metallopeptidase [Clostridia bacterium]